MFILYSLGYGHHFKDVQANSGVVVQLFHKSTINNISLKKAQETFQLITFSKLYIQKYWDT